MGLFGKAKNLIPQRTKALELETQNDLRIIDDCARILQTTYDSEVFYSRLSLFEERAKHLASLDSHVKLKGANGSQLLQQFYKDRDEIIQNFKDRTFVQRNPYSKSYYEHLEKIESMWSVMHNLGTFGGQQASQFEKACVYNIREYHAMVQWDEQNGRNKVPPPHVPAYVRLAMLYEKNSMYDKAIEVCVSAIRCGAYNDGSKGKMHGRLARMIKKSGRNVPQEIMRLTMEE